ncbi:unnamed protein product [Clavelina lepadiformis]|uniref:CxC3 like cysteine cluster domain-containing protein n=2 Tax=Clavelina lepadiformis TaxID=159417 RepID=A0ABP0G054_CLALP
MAPKSNIIRRVKAKYSVKIKGRRKRSVSLFCKTFTPALSASNDSPLLPLNTSELNDSSASYSGYNDSSTIGKQCYSEKRQKLSKNWRELEKKLLVIKRQSYNRISSTCYHCHREVDEIIRCSDCGPDQYFCLDCWHTCHDAVWFHSPDIWKGKMFCKMPLEPRTMKRSDKHRCNSQYTKHLTVVNNQGIQHDVLVEFCEGFCNALEYRYHRAPGQKAKVKKLSRILLQEVFEAYRHHVYQLQHMQDLNAGYCISGIDSGAVCPACEGSVANNNLYCFDGNFGLVRRKTAGIQSAFPRHQERFFCNQVEVDKFMNDYSEQETKLFDCSNFQAGSLIRSKKKSTKLDVKGVFGACCRHEFPKMFLDMKHGERLGYAVWILNQLLSSNKNLKICYDIACKLKSHLQIRKQHHILHRVDFAVPVFHGYGHKLSCQLQFSPRQLEGFGLTDGSKKNSAYCMPTEQYALDLKNYYKRIDLVNNITDSENDLTEHQSAIAKLDKELTIVERKLGISRWDASDEIFIQTITVAAENKRQEITQKILNFNVEKTFLSSLVKKYPVGQAIVNRLMTNIRKINRNLRKLIVQYNEMEDYPVLHQPRTRTLEDFGKSNSCPTSLDKQRTDCYNLLQRCKEEIELVKQDMLGTLFYYQRQVDILHGTVCKIPVELKAYVCTLQAFKEMELIDVWSYFEKIVDFQPHTPLLRDLLNMTCMNTFNASDDDDDETPSEDLNHLISLMDNSDYDDDDDDDEDL